MRPNLSYGRPGFTLLEVLLASSIGLVLLGGLYVAVSTQLQQMLAGREVIERSALVRAIFGRISSDVAAQVAPSVPASASAGGSASSAGGAAAPSSTASGGSTSATSTTGATGATGTGGTSGTTSGATGTSTAIQGTTVVTNTGVQGDSTRLTLFVTRMPRELTYLTGAQAASGLLPVVSDLRRVTYWLAGDGDQPLGLARQEVKLVTSDEETAAIPPDVPNPAALVIAPEVRNLTFAYFDGTAWTDTWDGTAMGTDGKTPLGPPTGIQITMDIWISDNGTGQPLVKTYQHFVAIPTANGTAQTTGTTATTTPASGTGTSTTGTTGS